MIGLTGFMLKELEGLKEKPRAVCTATGDTEALIAPFINMDVMEKHLALISQEVPKG